MIQGVNFDYKKFIGKAERVNKKIDLKSSNVLYLKEMPLAGVYVGLILGVILFVCFLIYGLTLFQSAIIFLVTFVIGLFITTSGVKKSYDIYTYHHLKKMVKDNNYEVYKYDANVDAMYVSQYLKSSPDDLIEHNKVKSNGNILLVDNQKIYLSQEVFNAMKFDKQIILYFAKVNDLCILFEYERSC